MSGRYYSHVTIFQPIIDLLTSRSSFSNRQLCLPTARNYYLTAAGGVMEETSWLYHPVQHGRTKSLEHYIWYQHREYVLEDVHQKSWSVTFRPRFLTECFTDPTPEWWVARPNIRETTSIKQKEAARTRVRWRGLFKASSMGLPGLWWRKKQLSVPFVQLMLNL